MDKLSNKAEFGKRHKDILLTVWITKNIKEELEKCSKLMDMNMSEYVRMAVKERVNKDKKAV